MPPSVRLRKTAVKMSLRNRENCLYVNDIMRINDVGSNDVGSNTSRYYGVTPPSIEDYLA